MTTIKTIKTMKRRKFFKGLLAAAVAGPSIIKSAASAPARVIAMPKAAAPVAAALDRGYMTDIREIVTQNMLRDIQEAEDRAFLTTLDNLPEIQAHRAKNPQPEGGTVIDDSLGGGFMGEIPDGDYRAERFKVTFSKIKTTEYPTLIPA